MTKKKQQQGFTLVTLLIGHSSYYDVYIN